MKLPRRILQCLFAALAMVGLMALPAQADIILFADYLVSGPIGDPDDELAFVIGETDNTNLTVFGKTEDGSTCEGGAACGGEFSKLDVVVSSDGNTADLSWADLQNWSLEYILVKDGSTGGKDGSHIYTLWAVTDAQATTGSGTICVPADGTAGDSGTTACPGPDPRGISHFTLFGEQTAVPEPATLLLLGAGLLGTVALARRRR